MFIKYLPENGGIYEIIRRNIVDPDRLNMTKRRMRFLCWLTKATDIQSEYVMKIISPR